MNSASLLLPSIHALNDGFIFISRLETERHIHQISKNNTRRFRFITAVQSCSLIQERFGERRISLDPSHDSFLEVASERHVNYLPRFPGLARPKDSACRRLARQPAPSAAER